MNKFYFLRSYLSTFKSFERRFGNTFLWFDYAQSDIIELSLRLYLEGKANLRSKSQDKEIWAD